ncbi:O-antigen polymerase [Sphingomicrobium arenosum]|uniref:O-antigen polymerase n=1 Tax=Sphingomicrobium arenosum TaxID=2233861 RepID=UPI00223EFD00|nr:O-antigen polymerase [Sphingomicrobium arenosum]
MIGRGISGRRERAASRAGHGGLAIVGHWRLDRMLLLAVFNLLLFFYVSTLLVENQRLALGLLCVANFGILLRERARPEMLLLIGFALIYFIFHIPLALIEVLSPDFIPRSRYFSYWYPRALTTDAIWIAAIFNSVMTSVFMAAPSVHYGNEMRALRREQDSLRGDVLLLPMLACILWFYAALFALGISNYNDYNEVVRTSDAGFVARSFSFLMIVLPTIIVLGAARIRWVGLYFTLLAIWCVPAFFLGLRGEVLFPLAMTMPVLLWRFGWKVRIIPSIVGAVVLLWMINLAMMVRGTGDLSSADESASALEAVAEMAGSLRPVYETLRWVEYGIMEPQGGATYWAPLERTLALVLPFIDRLPGHLDMRLMNVAIQEYAGNYGFSIAAEAFINFGHVGVVAMALVFGVVLIFAARHLGSGFILSRPLAVILSLAAANALFYHIRQSFVGAYGTFILTLILTAGFLWLDELVKPVRARRVGAQERS